MCTQKSDRSRRGRKGRKERKGKREKRKEEGKEKERKKRKRADAGSALGREDDGLGGEAEGILEGGHRDIILDYLYPPR